MAEKYSLIYTLLIIYKHVGKHLTDITQKLNIMSDKDENNNSSSNESDSNSSSGNSTPYRDSNTYVERTENQDGIVKK